jgi:hypothetical protein
MSHSIPLGGQGRDVRSTLVEALGDRKCYFPCKKCRGYNRRRLLIKTTKKHCREYGHLEGRHEYRPLVSYSLYVFILQIVFVNVYMLNVEEK